MTNNRIWVLGGVLVIFAILVLAGLLGVKPQLDAAQASTSERENVEALNAQKRIELVSLKEEFSRLDAISAQVGEVRKSIPASPDLDVFTGELAALQAAHGVTVTSYSPQAPSVFVPSEKAAANIPATVDATRFVTIPVEIIITGERQASLDFITGLQSGERLFLVTSVTATAADGGVSTTNITGMLYVLLNQPLVDPAAAATTPPPEPDAVAAQ
jgi:Tfp pilus assembly protein PilO